MKPSPASSFPVRLALLALRIYKAYFSVLFAGSCRFEPSCSRYAYEAIERFGLARGSWLALRRLLRCHPFSSSFGFDPVPEDEETQDHLSSPTTAAGLAPASSVRNEVRP